MWKTSNSLRTSYRYAYDVALVKIKEIQGDRYRLQRLREVQWLAEQWCEENCQREWSLNWKGNFSFDSQDDAMLFKLIWSGQV